MSDLFSELLEVINELPNLKTTHKKTDIMIFRQLFMGSDQGKRVYKELLSWGKLFNTSVYGTPIDPLKMSIGVGERNFAIKLMAAVNIEPPERETKARKKNVRRNS